MDNLVRLLRMYARRAGHRMTHSPTGANLISKTRLNHILTGHGLMQILHGGPLGGGHLWPGLRGKTPFPKHWSPDDIARHVSDIATDPFSTVKGGGVGGGLFTKKGNPARFRIYGVRDGVPIRVVVEPAGEGIITAFPYHGAWN